MFTDENPITVLGRSESWELLRRRTVGRIAASVAGQPDIFPINYYADDSSILFRTAPGTKLLEVTINGFLAFETDLYDPYEAWSVVVKGVATVLEKQADVYAAEALPLRSWLPTLKPVFVRILPTEVTGRRFRFGTEPELDL